MGMFTAYFDSSGHENDQHVLLTAGYVSTVEKWLKLDQEWKNKLAEVGIECLHMHKLMRGEQGPPEWKHDREARNRFLFSLVTVLKRRVHKGYACAVLLRDFREVDRQFTLSEQLGSPYTFIGSTIVHMVERWRTENYKHHPIRYFFEGGDAGQEDFSKFLRQSASIRPNFEDKWDKNTATWCYPFQVADFLAWVIAYHARLYAVEQPLELDPLYEHLERSIPSRWTIYEKDNLVRMCEELGVERRRQM